MTEIMVSRRDGIVRAPDGTQHRVHRGKTLADAAHPVVQAYPNDWQPMHVELAVDGARSHDRQVQDDDDLAELAEAAESYRAELVRLTDGLMARGVKVPDEGDRGPGWLVDLTLAQLDGLAATPAPRTPRAAKPRPTPRPADVD